MDDAIEYGVRERGLADDIVPFITGKLAGDERGAVAVAVLDDFHQIAPLVGGEPFRPPVVEDQQVGLDQATKQACEATVAVGELQTHERK